MTDPAGLPDIERGGHNPALSGYRVSVRQAAFHQRWQDRAPKAAGPYLLSSSPMDMHKNAVYHSEQQIL